jgi:glutamate-ammonia-ligase adenylyltransferase
MQHAGAVDGLRTTRTVAALSAAVEAGLLGAEDADALQQAWTMASRLRNAIVLVRGRPSDSLPRDTREKAAVAHLCGYGPGESDELVNDYLRLTRRARAVVEHVFWD